MYPGVPLIQQTDGTLVGDERRFIHGLNRSCGKESDNRWLGRTADADRTLGRGPVDCLHGNRMRSMAIKGDGEPAIRINEKSPHVANPPPVGQVNPKSLSRRGLFPESGFCVKWPDFQWPFGAPLSPPAAHLPSGTGRPRPAPVSPWDSGARSGSRLPVLAATC